MLCLLLPVWRFHMFSRRLVCGRGHSFPIMIVRAGSQVAAPEQVVAFAATNSL